MEDLSKVFTGAAPPRGSINRGSRLPEHWRLARAAHVDLLLMGMPRVNLLLIAPDGVTRYVLESLLLDLREPILHWSPGEPFELPPSGEPGTMILHDVGSLPPAAQLDLFDWLERDGGTTQVVSTTSTPLLPRVHCGAFIDMLYYRLNTICVDVSAHVRY
jgi:Sigma-54 interaction domain